ncbi:phosphoenolpyruvate-dependent sugar phosphotransferase system, EIIA 2 [Mycoplasma mycoides subsp. mycoides]|uniref:PTS fructose transporter subunit IIABC n=1 Tax=Mycoplasma mycoides TaxID=2102 RepID=UPI000768439D|nr:fructose-specific PTS transporter subunit EIIC [Mycoplasma mycoides]AME11005.1 phosphoenolpyruvate-dependent sugar phosphotransferase system, EIIA 2 [Mycoplasma mycoides subsp. mycoides]AME12025.1 phosphoenolpyruvate-dependent sugar phosphotransferase system, EIIA 2 [Mycoplasma mycoides subsp. mycoides]AME13055.1 phosphoenolpyruvate-dependent sugar phosphotransferase system, EIIA 2 [Mycoplasma mycoides subsp. mycoides]AME14080.1 phosphoenolpyruvate-dependent sugar phosphotransferase system, 
MHIKDLFNQNTSFFKQEFKTKTQIIDFLVSKLLEQKIISKKTVVLNAIKTREKLESTAIGDGIAIPHALNEAVLKPTVCFMSLKNPIKWNNNDNQLVDLVFLIVTNDQNGDDHITAIAGLSSKFLDSNVLNKLREIENFDELVEIFNDKKELKEELINKNEFFDVVGITACPTGIAHTYLASDKLTEYAKSLNLSIKIETQGRRGIENQLTEQDIKNAKVIILAHDKAIEGMSRFNNHKVIDTSTKDAIYNGKELISNFDTHPKLKEIKNIKADDSNMGELSLKKFKDFKGNLLGGVSRMLPFVVAGGIILGIAFLLDFITGNGNAKGDFGTVNKVSGWFAAAGKTAMMMMVPILGGYIAYAIVGPQGLMPGVVAGLLADNTGGFAYGTIGSWSGLWKRILPDHLPTNSGFIGAMVGGYLAAFIVFGLTIGMQKFKKPFHGVRDIVFIPILSLLGISLTMFVLNIPLGYLLYGIQLGLTYMAKNNLLIILGAIIGLMMCVDMGGPINKIAYVLGTASVSGSFGQEAIFTNIMAASMAGGMIPPLGIALCTVLFKKVWTSKERDAAKANWLMGSFFISEGAIPFMVTDPKRISVSALSGGFVTGLLVGAFKITLPAPHGGIFVFPLLNSELFIQHSVAKGMGIALFILAILIGTLVMTLILGFWKKVDINKGRLQLVQV